MASRKEERKQMFEDMIREILYRSSLKELYRVKVASKELNGLISDSEFMRDRDKRRLRGDEVIFYDSNFEEKIYSGECKSLIDYEKAWSCSLVGPPSCTWHGDRFQLCEPMVLGSYNGFIAMKTDDVYFTLWNPVTRECMNYDPGFLVSDPFIVGLCHDSMTDEYMVVLVSTIRYGYYGARKESRCIQLINFNTNSCKILNTTELEDEISCPQEVGVVVFGVPHWVMHSSIVDNPWERTSVLYFDLKEEMFIHMILPHQGRREKRVLGLGALNGQRQLGVVFHDRDDPFASYEVWVMKEYGKSETWINLFKFPSLCIQSHVESVSLIGFMPTGELLMRLKRVDAKGCKLKLLAYDPTKQRLKHMDSQSVWYYNYRIDSYEPSVKSPPDCSADLLI